MKNVRFYIVAGIFVGAFMHLIVAKAFAINNLADYCQEEYLTNASCPVESCRVECTPRPEFNDCLMQCLPRDCVEIDVEHCPTDTCQLLDGCSGEKVCYYKYDQPEPACGSLGYVGDSPCCEGLSKRCGIEFLDRSCDMKGEYSIYSVPVCIPCTDGVCINFENRCNCPEDCK